MKISTASILKAAAIGAGINMIIGLISGGVYFLRMDIVSTLVGLLGCCGGLLIPVMTGALYGFFTPGKETLAESAAGGAISGLVAGLVYGVFNGFSSAVVLLIDGFDFAAVMAASGVSLLLSCCGAIFFGSVLGAIGGAVWTAVQGDK